MNNIEMRWIINEAGKRYISSEGIRTHIEINEENKEIRNAKAFFREIIYLSFLNGWKKRIILVDDQDNEVEEVKTIIKELIQICNNEINAKYNN